MKVVEARTAKVKSRSNIATWPRDLRSEKIEDKILDHLCSYEDSAGFAGEQFRMEL